MGHFVYKYVYDYEIIYIGKNDTDLKTRIDQHKREDKFKPYLDQCDIWYFEVANSVECKCYESLLINKYKPKLNVLEKHEGLSIEFEEPRWNPYFEGLFKKIPIVKREIVEPDRSEEEFAEVCRLINEYKSGEVCAHDSEFLCSIEYVIDELEKHKTDIQLEFYGEYETNLGIIGLLKMHNLFKGYKSDYEVMYIDIEYNELKLEQLKRVRSELNGTS